MSGVRYIAKVRPEGSTRPPILIRLTRDDEGYEDETSWSPRLGEWEYSHYLLDDRVGKDNYDDLIDISEPQAREIQAAWQRIIDAQTAAPDR